jgi:hypothetical protein
MALRHQSPRARERDVGLEPGRWHRIVCRNKQAALGIGNACRLRIVNMTRTLDCKSTLAAPTLDAIAQEGTTICSGHQLTSRFRPAAVSRLGRLVALRAVEGSCELGRRLRRKASSVELRRLLGQVHVSDRSAGFSRDR